MFFKTTVSEISNTNPLFNFRNNGTTEYVFNARYLSNILNNNGGSSFVLINNYDRRGRDIYFESSTSVVDIIDEMDSPSANGYYTLNYFKNDNPAKAVLNRDIPIDHIIALFAYWNPSYTWLVFDSYNDYRRVLINDTLDDIFTELTTATTTLATTTLITTTVATTTPIPTTTGVTTTAGPTTTFAGTTYYVSNTGSDSADGLTPATAWQTVAKVNASTFDPDTQILFKCGDTWRETLEVPSAGTSGQYLYFGNYGTGSNPRILGSKATTTWADQGSNIWKTDITFVNPRSLYPNYADIVFNVGGAERFGVYQANTASLNTEFEWTWSSNYIYIYSTSDPATAYTGIEVPQRRFCVSTNDNSYVQFDGIDAAYSADVGYDSNNDHTVSDQHGCIIENCEIKFIGGVSTGAYQFGFGIAIAYSNLTIRNCEIHHIGRRGISINMEYTASPYTVHDILIENNIFHHGSHTTSLDMTVNNGGSSSSIDGVVFRNNLIYETNGASVNYPSVQMWYQSYTGTGTIDNVYIYNNIFKYWRDNCLSLESRRIENVYIYNNTFYENNSVGGYYGTSYCINADTDSNNVLRLHLRNNIFYTTFPNDTGGNGALLVMYLVNLGNQDIDYDLYYRINNSVRIMLLNGTSYYMNTAFPTPEGYETHGIKDNPDFVVGSAYRLQATSPAIGTGVHTGSVTYDYDGELRNNPPCIGADEYSAATTAAPTTTAVTTTLVTTTPAPTTTPAATTTPAPTTTSATTTTSAGTTTAGSTTSTTTTTTTTTTSGGYCDEYQAVYDAMTNKPSEAHADAQNTFVEAAIAHGYWDNLELFQFYAQDSRTNGESLLNWVSPGTHNASEVSGIAWTQYQGYTGDGSADCINMNYNPNDDGGKFTQDSASWGVYVRTNIDENARVLMQNANNMVIPRAGNLSYWRINYGVSSTIANTDSRGFYVAVRSNATTIDYYKNGKDIGGGTANSTVIQDYGFYAVGHPDWYTFSTQQIAVTFVGSALTPTEVANFNTDLEALMDAIGSGVQ